ncbi:MAG TPA: carbamoyl-phosphate synthase large subunit, partial [Candidatus Omnitrophota bacterium]|nr:carbamoyl-phosphate synthase large subunit [Candidatus Omnitrophota bacterium]
RSLETKRFGLGGDGKDKVLDQALETREEYLQFIKTVPHRKEFREKIMAYAKTPREDRIFYLKYAYLAGYTTEEIYRHTSVDPWFLAQLKQIIDMEQELLQAKGNTQTQETMMRKAKEYGFSDRQLAFYWGLREGDVRKKRKKLGIKPVYKLVDTCAAEFKAYTPYFYSTYEEEDEANPSKRKKVMILGGGPSRIGQGIEFDYCCVHAVLALKKMGYETIMVNSNPETVSTDYDTSDKLFFEPLTLEDVLNIYENEKPLGVILQLGGQTPLNLAKALEANGVRILGTSVKAIDRAEDRDKFKRLLHKIQLSQPANGIATSLEEACEVAKKIGYPVVVRPSYVLGGRAMEIAYDESSLKKYMKKAVEASGKHPVLIDKFLEDATEMDVDLISDGKTAVVGAVMEHIEEAGIHSGDSASVIPPFSVARETVEEIIFKTKQIAKELQVVGLMNVQYAIQKGQVYCLEVNPRASRTVPFVSKTIGVPLAKLAAQLMVGKTLKDLKFTEEISPKHVAVKESVFPFVKFPGVDIILSPEMKSTGEVMGIDKDFGKAFYKSQDAAMSRIPKKGTVFISVKDSDKPKIPEIARAFHRLGFKVVSTKGTAQVLRDYRVPVQEILKITEGSPNIADWVRNKKMDLIINTPSGKGPMLDEGKIRSLAVSFNIPCITTVSAARAAVRGLQAVRDDELDVKSIHDYHGVKMLKG